MKQRKLNGRSPKPMSIVAMLGLLILGVTAQAGAGKFDKQMRPVLKEYLKIPRVLAADQTEGVVKAAKKIKQLATKLEPSSASEEHANHYKDIPKNLQASATKMIKAKDLKGMREALKELSKPMAMWATMSKPKGISVLYCSMAPGSWLQSGTTVANPYYGAKMLRCGDIVAGEGDKKKGEHKSHGGKHGKHSGHNTQGQHRP